MRIVISYIFTCLALIGCSDPEQTQNSSSPSGEQTQDTASPEVVYSVSKTEQGFEPPKQVASSPLFKLVSVASSEKPTAELSSVNYQIRVK